MACHDENEQLKYIVVYSDSIVQIELNYWWDASMPFKQLSWYMLIIMYIIVKRIKVQKIWFFSCKIEREVSFT